MMRDPTAELARLTAVIRDAEALRMRGLTEEEVRIRADLAALDARRRDAQALPVAELAMPRSVGADILWHAWAGRAHEDLQMRLARVLARKGAAMRGLQTAHGRCEAAESLYEQARQARAEQQEKARIALEQSLFFLSRGNGAARRRGDRG